MTAGYDLHTHSLCSDGTRPPAEVVTLAAQAGLSGIALTDHDTVAGWDEARVAAMAHDVEFVPGIELSAERGETSVHLLGLWVDGENGALLRECERLRAERERRMGAVLDRLAALDAAVDEARVRALAADAPIGRPHIAQALVEQGVVPDIETAFAELLGDGCPAWEPKRALDPIAAVMLIRRAGGAAVLAHPGLSGGGGLPETLLDELGPAGLAGVEAEHPHHEPEVVEHWRREAAARGLLVTGASDFHGARRDVTIGARTTSLKTIARLRERRAGGEQDGDPTPTRRRSGA